MIRTLINGKINNKIIKKEENNVENINFILNEDIDISNLNNVSIDEIKKNDNYLLNKDDNKLIDENQINLINSIITDNKNKQFNNNNLKLLTLIATHIDTELKFKTLKSNLKYFDYSFNTIIIINSFDLKFNKELNDFCNFKNILYYECVNDMKSCDFGKWMFILNQNTYKNFDKVLFTNESFIICDSIDNFIISLMNNNDDLYAYNSSSQIKFHYQSYLFGINSLKINCLISYYESIKLLLKNQEDVIKYLELELFNIYDKANCYLNIAYFESNKGENIFFTNDLLYFYLLENNFIFYIYNLE
jgi:hypothetical protein